MNLAVVLGVWIRVAVFSAAEEPQDHKPCECVPVYHCDLPPSQDGTGLTDIRFVSGGCPNLVDVCCDLNHILPSEPSTGVPPEPPPLSAYSCGVPHPQQLSTRITADWEAPYGQFPWMAAILGPGRKFICGGSLIHPQVVLTAAHCVTNKNKKDLTVRLGEWDSQTKNEPLPVQNRAVTGIIIHEQFTPGPLYNDIALMFLDIPVELGGNIDIICLPEPNEIMDGRKCVASGWGKDAFGPEGKHNGILRSVELSVVPREECQHNLRETRLGDYFRLHVSFMCAGGEEGKDTCKGDGGGPLVCPETEGMSVYEQAGIVSWGINCGHKAPAAYTNVAIFRSWIDLQMVRQGLIR